MVKKKKAKWVKHIIKEGARYHVIWWDNLGAHCSEPNCEINRPIKRSKKSAPLGDIYGTPPVRKVIEELEKFSVLQEVLKSFGIIPLKGTK
jgi:hypothetical protein